MKLLVFLGLFYALLSPVGWGFPTESDPTPDMNRGPAGSIQETSIYPVCTLLEQTTETLGMDGPLCKKRRIAEFFKKCSSGIFPVKMIEETEIAPYSDCAP